MNLYEFEGKQFFEKHNIKIPRGTVMRRDDDVAAAYESLGIADVVVKAQVLSGKRGKGGGIKFANNAEDVVAAVKDIFNMEIRGQHVAAVRIEEKLDIAKEHYVSVTYDSNAKQAVLVYSAHGGVDIEDVPEEHIDKQLIDVHSESLNVILNPSERSESRVKNPDVHRTSSNQRDPSTPLRFAQDDVGLVQVIQNVWTCFIENDCRLVEINPLVQTTTGDWYAADAKVAIDDDAFYRHEEWKDLEPRTMMGRPPTERELMAREIDAGEKYYQGTAGKYIEMDGDIAILFSGGGASIANMDALNAAGLSAANYTEYSGNPPREKVHALAKVVLTKPGLRGLWIAGGVANFTNQVETFLGIIDALDELKPTYPIVVRKDGPHGEEARQLMLECATRNNLNMKMFGKDMAMSETANVLADMIN